MAFLEKLRFNLWDGKEMVERLVDEWKPRRCATEKDYEKSLYKFLHEKFEEIQITKQYARGRIRADIVVGDKIIVELKNNLNTTNKYQRLLGQLAQYKSRSKNLRFIDKGLAVSNA